MNDPKIRIGRIDFTNVWPIYFHFPEAAFTGEIRLEKQVPTTLNRAMMAGEIDMGPISSFAYGVSCDDYVLFPDLSVSAYGNVNSILLFHRRPLTEVVHGTIALPTTSATSVNLLKILIAEFYGGSPTYYEEKPSLALMMKGLRQTDAALLIGDDAIRANWANAQTGELLVTDLGELWRQNTGEWMSFAVWAVRRAAVEREPELIARLYAAFLAGKTRGLADPSEMIAAAVASVGGEASYWRDYFGQLCYDFGPSQWSGLTRYYALAYKHGLLAKPAPIHIWNPNDTLHGQVKL